MEIVRRREYIRILASERYRTFLIQTLCATDATFRSIRESSLIKCYMTKSKTIKTLLFSIFLFFIGQIAHAQKTEINLDVYSGLFSFRGNGAASRSWMS